MTRTSLFVNCSIGSKRWSGRLNRLLSLLGVGTGTIPAYTRHFPHLHHPTLIFCHCPTSCTVLVHLISVLHASVLCRTLSHVLLHRRKNISRRVYLVVCTRHIRSIPLSLLQQANAAINLTFRVFSPDTGLASTRIVSSTQRCEPLRKNISYMQYMCSTLLYPNNICAIYS